MDELDQIKKRKENDVQIESIKEEENIEEHENIDTENLRRSLSKFESES